MLDTKLKKSHKIKNLIIALIVLLPALILVSLYPRMEKAMLERKEYEYQQYEESKERYENMQKDEAENSQGNPTHYLESNFVNYVVQASYYQYAMLLQDATGREVSTDVLEYYGWVNDYYELTGSTPFFAQYMPEQEAVDGENLYQMEEGFELSEEERELLFDGKELPEERSSELRAQGLMGYLAIEYDPYGKLSDIRLQGTDRFETNLNYGESVYRCAMESVNQYQTNVGGYEYDGLAGIEVSESMLESYQEVCPKNFRAIWLLYEDNSRFLSPMGEYEVYYDELYDSPEKLYLEIGAYWIVAILAAFVALAALILPLFKKLETGWEKLFSMPLEIVIILIGLGVSGAIGMCAAMSCSTMDMINSVFFNENSTVIELLGYRFSPSQCYGAVLVMNFFGWAACFFTEYICVAQLRQFFCGPAYYLKNRLLTVKAGRWCVRQCKKIVNYVMDIDINESLHKSILKLVIANFFVVTVLCCFWFVGIFGVILYSVLLYFLLRKYGSRLQRQYRSILDATGQMAEGDLKISLEEDLGVFKPLGEELEKVQQGFSKAVAEEAKSQNMKSELITNVSHDLKTPLTAIITYVDLLKKPDLTEEERNSYIETLDLKSQRLKVLIEDLFEVSKANSGNVKMNFMDVDIVNLMKEVRLEMEDKISQSNLLFRWNLPEEKVVLSLDGQRTYRIFENLLNNAMKYAMPFTRVYVDIVNQESEVVITFKNMSAQELNFEAEHLTERFVRGDSARNSEGSGLGLAIAKSFTELQNGQFSVSVDGDLFKVVIRFLKK